MATVNEVLIQTLKATQMLLHRYVGDLKPAQLLHRTSPKANCVAWIMGHLILTERSLLKNLGVTALPELPAGFEERYGRSEDAALKPDFGDTSVLLPLWDAHRKLSIDAVPALTPAQLDKPLETPRPLFGDLKGMINFVGGIHVAMHGGQVTLIRRSLGMPPLV